jgi:hypothetical protein
LSSMTDVMMQMMMRGQAGMPAANVSDLLATLAERDPRMAPLVQQLQVRLAARENAPQGLTEEDSAIVPQEQEIIEPEKHPARTQKLRKLAKTMFAELQELRSRNDMLADVLGACHLCWGEDATCVYCAGQGRVAAYLIDPKVFEDVIGPAAQQVMQRPQLVNPQTTDKGEGNHAGL